MAKIMWLKNFDAGGGGGQKHNSSEQGPNGDSVQIDINLIRAGVEKALVYLIQTTGSYWKLDMVLRPSLLQKA